MFPPAGDVQRGAELFKKKCQNCHTVFKFEQGSPRMGPSLRGFLRRKAGSEPAFEKRYSIANKTAGFMWSEELLKQYLFSPQKVIPGTNKPFSGLQSKQEVDDLIAFLIAES